MEELRNDRATEYSNKNTNKLGDNLECTSYSLESQRSTLARSKSKTKKCLLNVKVFLIFTCIFSIAQGFALNGVNNVNIPMYERRFQLTSTQAGLEASFYDIIALLTVLPIGYYGVHLHQPRLLAIASGFLALGSLTLALPHFLTGAYQPRDVEYLLCDVTGTDRQASCSAASPGLSNYLYVLLLGQSLHGFAGTILYVIGPAFIDGSVSAEQSPIYLGTFYGSSALGPAIGYLLGGHLLDKYVDIPQPPPNGLSPESPAWVGAWWIGFLISFGMCLSLVTPFCLYPRVLPGTVRRRQNNASQAHDSGIQSKADRKGFGRSIKDLPTSIQLLMKNPAFVSQCIVSGCEGLLISGMSTFLPKFIANQFNQKASFASMLTGILAVPAALVGQFLGGFVVRRWNMKVKTIMTYNLCCCIAVIVFATVFWTKCDQQVVAGVTAEYNFSSIRSQIIESPNLQHECNAHCKCTTSLYEPVCANNIEFFSACHAGCTSTPNTSSSLYHQFGACSCVPKAMNATTEDIRQGKCDSECIMLYIFAPIGLFAFLITFMMTVPGTTVILRSVNDNQRTFAVSLQQMAMRLIGTIPGPLLFGAVLDSSCLVWQQKCKTRGSCWIYDNNKMGRNFYILMVALKTASAVSLILGRRFYVAPSTNNPTDNSKNKRMTSDLPTNDGIGDSDLPTNDGVGDSDLPTNDGPGDRDVPTNDRAIDTGVIGITSM